MSFSGGTASSELGEATVSHAIVSVAFIFRSGIQYNRHTSTSLVRKFNLHVWIFIGSEW